MHHGMETKTHTKTPKTNTHAIQQKLPPEICPPYTPEE